MRRIAIVGSGGAGKTTLARAMGERLGLPVVHLDHLFWGPGWVETPKDEWRARQASLLAGDAWIADGNYGGTLDLRLPVADTVVFLDLPRTTCVLGVLRRRGGEQAPGCPDRVTLEFLRWVWRYGEVSRPKVEAALAGHPNVVRLRSRRAVRRFVESLS